MIDRFSFSSLRPFVLVAVAAVAYLAWHLRTELVVVFAGTLFGVALYTVSSWLSERTGLPHRAAVVTWFVTGLLVAGGFFVFAGQRLSSEYGEFGARLPSALQTLEEDLRGTPFVGALAVEIRDIREQITQTGEGPAPSESEQRKIARDRLRIMQVTLRGLSYFGVVVFIAFFLAFDGRSYERGLVLLAPPEQRHVMEDLLDALRTALPWWLVGRLSSMAVVAVLTIPGLLLLDIPLAFLLAVIAGLFSFVPFVGPIASVVPAVLLTLELDPGKVVWVVALYALVQLLESHVITPTIQKRVASVPPALLLFAQLFVGTLTGIVGLIFATPLALALMVTTEVVYVRHGLGEEVATPRGGAAH